MRGLSQRGDSNPRDLSAKKLKKSFLTSLSAQSVAANSISLHGSQRRLRGRYSTSDGELHGTRGEAKGVPCYALVSALVSHTQVLNGEGPILADVELATLCDLDALLLHHQKTKAVSEHGKLPSSPAFSLLSKPRDGCDEQMWPPDVSIALPEKPERSPRTPVPDGTHSEEVLAQLLPLAQPRSSPQDTPKRHPTQTPHTDRLAGTSPRP